MTLSPITSEPVGLHGISYRPEIDGLRAVAVLAVVFYHVGLGCPGGYVGVDVFFVISGYLITAILLRDLERGRFSISGFWERRIRRIVPALSVMIAATLLAGWFLLLPDDLAGLGSSAVAQSLCVANIYFWRTTNYFGGANEEKPLLHTWSLAVEEQFYLFFPILLIMMYRSPFLRRHMLLILSTLAAMSLGLSIWALKPQPYATFFLLPTRAWELLLGAIVASLPAQWFLSSRLGRENASVIGVLLVIVPMFVYGESTPFPGLAALAPCLGAVALIWGNQPSAVSTGTWIARFLSLKPIVFVGLISYSLYLWHWPVMAFALYWKTAPLSVWSKSALVTASFVLGILSWYFVERRFRNRSVLPSTRKLLAVYATSIFAFVFAGVTFRTGDGFAQRLPPAAQAILKAASDRELRRAQQPNNVSVRITAEDIQDDNIPTIGGDSSLLPDFLVWGDSHAKVAIPAFEHLSSKFGRRGHAAVVYSTPPMIGLGTQNKLGRADADEVAKAIVDYVHRNHIADVFVIAYWSLYSKDVSQTHFEQCLRETTANLSRAGARVWVILDVPNHDVDVPKALVRSHIFGIRSWNPNSRTQNEHRQINEVMYRFSQRSGNVITVDAAPFLFDTKSERLHNRERWHSVVLR